MGVDVNIRGELKQVIFHEILQDQAVERMLRALVLLMAAQLMAVPQIGYIKYSHQHQIVVHTSEIPAPQVVEAQTDKT